PVYLRRKSGFIFNFRGRARRISRAERSGKNDSPEDAFRSAGSDVRIGFRVRIYTLGTKNGIQTPVQPGVGAKQLSLVGSASQCIARTESGNLPDLSNALPTNRGRTGRSPERPR